MDRDQVYFLSMGSGTPMKLFFPVEYDSFSRRGVSYYHTCVALQFRMHILNQTKPLCAGRAFPVVS